MENSELIKQSIIFSINIVDYYKWLINEQHEFVMSKQILRSGTSIGANIHEAKYAISKADFLNKLYISLKETSETEYWLIILDKSNYKNNKHYALQKQCEALKKMLISSVKTLKNDNLSKK